MKTVRTVLGEITPEGLGPVNGHEHVFQVSPLLPGDELDDPERSSAEVELLRGSGFAAMIDATPIGLGRRATDLRRISESTSVQIVASTGVHRDAHYAADHRSEERRVGKEHRTRWLAMHVKKRGREST